MRFLPLLIFLIFVSTMLGASPAMSQGFGHMDPVKGELHLSATSGKVPFTITITGPQEFLSIAQKYRGGRHMGQPYVIYWGDGKESPNWDEKFDGSHTYTVPGTYTIRASLLRWHPNDSTSSKWLATEQVTVTTSDPIAPHLKVLAPTSEGTYAYEEYPELVLDLQTNTRSDLLMELIDERNLVIARETIENFSYSSPRFEHEFQPPEFDQYQEALRLRGKQKCHIKLQLKDQNGKVLATANTPPFFITPILSKSMTKLHLATVEQLEDGHGGLQPPGSGGVVIPAVKAGDNPLEVILRFTANHKYDFSYELDWGDGSKPARKIASITKNRGLLEGETIYFKHVYPKAGKYVVKLRSTDLDPLEPLEKVFCYEVLQVNPGGK